MAVLDIISLPQPVLRRKARKVTEFGSELQTLIDDMVETMRAAPGVGLAAPQVAVSWRVIVIEYNDDEENEETPPKLYTLVNPEITRFSNETLLDTEGCLSIPSILGDVERAELVTVKAQNRRGKPVTVKARGWLARIFQHEIDHLEGVLFVDRAEKAWKVELQPGQVLPDMV